MNLIAFLLILAQITIPFFHSGEEKEARQLHQQAELAMSRNDYEAAKESYTQLLEKTSPPNQMTRKQKVDWASYVDLVLRLCSAHLQLKEFSNAGKLLQDLLEKKPPPEFLPQIKILKGRSLSGLQAPERAFAILREVEEILPFEEWRPEDRTFYHSLEYFLDIRLQENLQKAHRLFASEFYKEAAELYEDLFTSLENEKMPERTNDHHLLKKKVRFRLAETHYLLANYEKTLALLESSKNENGLDTNVLYLLAKAYQERKEYEKALDNFESYLKSANVEELTYYEQALFEKGVSFFQLNRFENSKKTFETLLQIGKWKTKPVYLSALFLTRIYIKENSLAEAEEILSHLSSSLPSQDPLYFEAAFLAGEIAFQKKDYLSALKSFEKCFPSSPLSGRWCQEAIFRMGLCYLKMGDDLQKPHADRELFFTRAEGYFTRLLKQTDQRERATLALAKIYYLKSYHLNEADALQKIESLLAVENPAFSSDGKLYALLLRAIAVPSFTEKVKFLETATYELPPTSPLYAECWFQKGLVYFEGGLNEKIRSTTLLEKSIDCFEKALAGYEKNQKDRAGTLIECEALACCFVHIPQKALLLCQSALDNYPLTPREKRDILYLQGLIALQLRDENSLELAKRAFQELSGGDKEVRHADAALYCLGALYYQKNEFEKAHQAFLSVPLLFPTSPWLADCWFWGAEALERCGEPVTELRENVYLCYPNSAYAPESYFRKFPFSSDVAGEKDSIDHLTKFSLFFPSSPLRIAAFTLLGMHALDGHEAIDYYKQALEIAESSASFPPEIYYFIFRARLELAQCLLESPASSEHLAACSLLEILCKDISARTDLFSTDTSFLSIESDFTLSLSYLKIGKRTLAQQQFSQILARLASRGIIDGYFPGKIWEEQGKLALDTGEYETALSCFEMAEESGKLSFCQEHILNLWIHKSDCLRELKKWDHAMRLLSQVINNETISPLRVKAMLLRAEIYELQGRHELALRQLEAAAKKGGSWAEEAKKRLKNGYGLEV